MFKIRPRGQFALRYVEAEASHPDLGHTITLKLPLAARHRPVVRRFLAGKYAEPFSHLAFARLMARQPGRNVVHAGAFFGDMLHSLAQVAATVFAFEPVLDNYIFAKKNAAALGLSNVVLINAGLGDHTGLARIVTHSQPGVFDGGGSQFRPDPAPGEQSELAPVFRLDDLPLGDVALLHLDVEGHELPALTGAQALIDRCRPVILIEDNAQACAGFLSARGYGHCYRQDGLDYWTLPEHRGGVMALRPPGQSKA